MHWIDWLIVAVPLLVVFYVATRAQKYVKGVSDFLAAGRVAGRFVVAVAGDVANMGLISLVALFEAYYNSGAAYLFWQSLGTALGIMFLLFGYCIYRFRETRAMTMGQFLEMRYNRPFRIFSAVLQSVSGIINYALFPAIGARFLIYFCDLPLQVNLLGMVIPTFGLVMAGFLSIAVIITCMGGQITIMVTDCVQGILSYPLYAIVVIYLLTRFSWSLDIAPTILDRAPGESMVNPFDIGKLRTFNMFYVFVGIVSSVFNRMSWSGAQGYNVAALNAHEQKMGAVLGTWRGGFLAMVCLILALAGYTLLNNEKFADEATLCRRELAAKAVDDVITGGQCTALKQDIHIYLETGTLSIELQDRFDGLVAEGSKEPLRDIIHQAIGSEDKIAAQSFTAIFGQMRVPMALRHMLPVGVMGAFCALCVFLLISTDTTYMHSWGSIIVQDLILPIRGKPLTPRQQLRLLRFTIAGVAVFAFLFSFFFAQIDYILMFFAITGAIWLGGAGPCIIGGLYWKRGTTAGAFSALISGSSIATGGMILQKLWVPYVYPWLAVGGHVAGVAKVVEVLSRPLEPYIKWRVTPDAFPINSQEIYFLAMLIGIVCYIVVSLLTCREPCNMERLLHRGKYRCEGEEIVKEKLTFRTVFRRLVGINSQYTRGDRVLARLSFLYSIGWIFGSFVVLCIWNALSPWPDQWWIKWFQIYNLIVPGIIGVLLAVCFTIGGTWDLRRMFKRLAAKEDSMLDDGRVVGHVSADDVAMVEKVDHAIIKEAHIEEHELKEALQKESEKQ